MSQTGITYPANFSYWGAADYGAAAASASARQYFCKNKNGEHAFLLVIDFPTNCSTG